MIEYVLLYDRIHNNNNIIPKVMTSNCEVYLNDKKEKNLKYFIKGA